MSRPRPVAWFAAVIAVLQATLGFGGITHLFNVTTIIGLQLALVVLIAAGAAITQSAVTPVSDPRNNDGVRLIPQVARAQYSASDDI